MPSDYWGINFGEEDWRRARAGGLSGAVELMAQNPNDDWAETIQLLSAGFHRGMEGSLASSVKQREADELARKKAEEEAEKLEQERRQREAEERGAKWYEEQFGPEELATRRPRETYPTTGDYLKDLSSDFEEREKTAAEKKAEEEEYEGLAAAVRQLRPDLNLPEGVRVPTKILEEALKESVKGPDKLTPSESLAREKWGVELEDRAEAEESELLTARKAGLAYGALPPEIRQTVRSPYRYGSAEEALNAYAEAEQRAREGGRGMDQARSYITEMGGRVTGDDVLDRREYDRLYQTEQEAKAASKNGKPGEIKGTSGATSGLPMAPAATKPASTAFVGNGRKPEAATTPNPKALDRPTFSALLQRAGLQEGDARMLSASPELMRAVQADWAAAKTKAEEAAIVERLRRLAASKGWVR